MKLLSCIVFAFCVSVMSLSQNCKKLDTKLFFTSINFGDQVPGELITCAGKGKLNPSDINRFIYDSLSQGCKKKYADLFTFQSFSFSFSQIGTNRKKQILFAEMYSFFEDRRNDSSIYDPPGNFIDLYKKLVSLYGHPTRIKTGNHTDSLFIKELGMPRVIAWECNNIFLYLRIRYGSRNKDLNVFHIQIINRKFDLLPEELEYINLHPPNDRGADSGLLQRADAVQKELIK